MQGEQSIITDKNTAYFMMHNALNYLYYLVIALTTALIIHFIIPQLHM